MADTQNSNREKKIKHFRLALIDDRTHKQLWTGHFTRTRLVLIAFSFTVVLCAVIYSTIAFTPIRTFIPGYPDARSKRAAIQNAIRVDSLENVILRWELYSENLKRVMEGDRTINLDSIINIRKLPVEQDRDLSEINRQDSLLRQHVKEEEQFDISARERRDLPIEGLLFFTPLKGVISQGYDPIVHPYIDITAASGSVVKAILDGTVIFDAWNDDTGYTIQIQHEGDIVSIYKHNEKLLKKTGDKVTAGAPIALIGDTGKISTGDHLHFELWYKGETVDPTKHINF